MHLLCAKVARLDETNIPWIAVPRSTVATSLPRDNRHLPQPSTTTAQKCPHYPLDDNFLQSNASVQASDYLGIDYTDYITIISSNRDSAPQEILLIQVIRFGCNHRLL